MIRIEDIIEITARAIWLERSIFPDKARHWDSPGEMLAFDRQPYLDEARAALKGLEVAGFVIVPKEPTPEMISTAAPLAAHAPGERDFGIALKAVDLLPQNENPDIADVLAQMAVDYRAMIEARPK